MLHDYVVFFGDCKILFKFHYISSVFWSNFRITSQIIFMCRMAFKNEYNAKGHFNETSYKLKLRELGPPYEKVQIICQVKKLHLRNHSLQRQGISK